MTIGSIKRSLYSISGAVLSLAFLGNPAVLAPKEKLLQLSDRRITNEGVIAIKVQEHRSQEQNRTEALTRLKDLVKSTTIVPKLRKPSKPSRSSQAKRLDSKTKRSQIKATRGNVTE